MFGDKPSTKVHSPLEKVDHPELDTSELLDKTGVQQYQSLIGSLQWAISLARFDIATAVMFLSSFWALPCQGHLELAQRICSYLYRMRHDTIYFRTHELDSASKGLPSIASGKSDTASYHYSLSVKL
jgi:hypothetical protein